MSLISHASLPRHSPTRAEQAETQKRKRDDAEGVGVELDRRPFTIRSDASDPFAAPRVFTPICLIPRAQLPLAYLDTSTVGTRCFSAYIRALESPDEEGEMASVLITENAKEGRLYAIERAQRRTYALCKLGEWVRKEDLQRAASVVLRHKEQQVKRRAVHPVGNEQPWWGRAAVDVLEDHGAELSGPVLPTLAMSIPSATNLGADRSASLAQLSVTEHHGDVLIRGPLATESTSATDVFQELEKQYQEALYLSRTSLAYFTKGPLSRARAAFSGQPDTSLQTVELTAFLREAILTASVVDKKYKDGVAGVVKELAPAGLETPEQPAKPKKKRQWKAKRDKSGFFADEKEYVERWWRARDETGGAPVSHETVDAGLKRRSSRLRSRETYLQVILALEVLALEVTNSSKPEPQEPGEGCVAESQDQETQQDSQAPKEMRKQKTKKPQDLPGLLEVLLDRLCIWHSLDSHSPAKRAGKDEDDSQDELKSFCVEVILPFYISRCPQHATAVNKKLGGPSGPTPVKRKSTSTRKPGEPATRPAPGQKPRKPLTRVSTETLHATRKNLPQLHRSATDSAILQQQIKRETSETPSSLDSIPAAKPPPQPRKRTSLMHSISFSRREVDLSAMSQANEVRMRKKADVEEKLREAITTLKKPNRARAVKEVAANADPSFANAMRGKGRGPAVKSRPGVGTLGSAVHVAATPKHGRSIKATPGRRSGGESSGLSGQSERLYAPSSSARLLAPPPRAVDDPPTSSFAVPQTGHRPRHATPAAAANVEDTPSRGFAKFMPPGLARQPGTLESPIAARHAQVQQTPVRPVRSLSLVPPAAEALVEASPNTVRTTSPEETGLKGQNNSIYDALRWDEDYEQLA